MIIGSTLCEYRIRVCCILPISCLHRRLKRRCNADQHQVDIVATSYVLNPVYIVYIVDITMLIISESTCLLHGGYIVCLPSCLHRLHCNFGQHFVNILFTYFYIVYDLNVKEISAT